MLDGVMVTPLKKFADERGSVMHMLRADSPLFERFGEVYFSTINPGFIKGWHNHTRITQNYAVPHGRVLFALYDVRDNSSTCGQIFDVELGDDKYALLTVPPGLWYGFKAMGASGALIANCATEPHDPTESVHLDINDTSIPYRWNNDTFSA